MKTNLLRNKVNQEIRMKLNKQASLFIQYKIKTINKPQNKTRVKLPESP